MPASLLLISQAWKQKPKPEEQITWNLEDDKEKQMHLQNLWQSTAQTKHRCWAHCTAQQMAVITGHQYSRAACLWALCHSSSSRRCAHPDWAWWDRGAPRRYLLFVAANKTETIGVTHTGAARQLLHCPFCEQAFGNAPSNPGIHTEADNPHGRTKARRHGARPLLKPPPPHRATGPAAAAPLAQRKARIRSPDPPRPPSFKPLPALSRETLWPGLFPSEGGGAARRYGEEAQIVRRAGASRQKAAGGGGSAAGTRGGTRGGWVRDARLLCLGWGCQTARQPGARQPPVTDGAVPPGRGWRLQPAEVSLRVSVGLRSCPRRKRLSFRCRWFCRGKTQRKEEQSRSCSWEEGRWWCWSCQVSR